MGPDAESSAALEELQYPRTRGIESLHRHDGYISFAVKSSDGRFSHLASIQRSQLDSVFPFFRERLEKDSFISINASYRETFSRNRSPQALWSYHGTPTLRYLCACYADIDYYKTGRTFNQAFFEVLEAQEKGQIPPPSMVIHSGRGMWLLWLLRDRTNPEQAHFGAWANNPLDHALLYVGIQREICRGLAPIGADPQGIDAARHVRIEGSFHTEAEKYVRWWIHGQGERAFTYTLKGMADFFGLRLASTPVPRRATNGEKKPMAHHYRGHLAAGQTKLKVIELLFEQRNGFAEGQRNKGLLLYAMALRGAHIGQLEAMERVGRMARDCKIYTAEAQGVVRSAYRQKTSRLSYKHIADTLVVTPDEANNLSRLTRRPFPAATAFPANELRQSQSERQVARRAAIKRIIESCAGKVPSYREMCARLAGEGIEAARGTIQNDYQAVGLESEETRSRRIQEDLKRRQSQLIAWDAHE